MQSKTLIISDVHGCLAELEKLLDATGFLPGYDRCVCLGDLTDRGPDSPGVIRLCRALGIESVMGNHDHKLLRRAKHITKAIADPRYRVPMRFSADQVATISALSQDELDWLAGLPFKIELPEFNAVLVHAGLLPGVLLQRQPPEAMLMVRYIHNVSNRMLSLKMPGFEQPENSVLWTERWNESYDVIFGHNVNDLQEIGVWNSPRGGGALGLTRERCLEETSRPLCFQKTAIIKWCKFLLQRFITTLQEMRSKDVINEYIRVLKELLSVLPSCTNELGQSSDGDTVYCQNVATATLGGPQVGNREGKQPP